MSLYRDPRAARSSSAPAPSSGRGASTAPMTAAHRREDPRMQQATVNLLSDMGAQPGDAPGGLVRRRCARRDGPDGGHHRPSARRDRPRRRRHGLRHGRRRRRRRRRVEVSTDGGATWQPATGTTSWTYTFSAGRGAHHRAGARHRRRGQHRHAGERQLRRRRRRPARARSSRRRRPAPRRTTPTRSSSA